VRSGTRDIDLRVTSDGEHHHKSNAIRGYRRQDGPTSRSDHLPLTGEGFAGSAHLTFAGMAWFAAAQTLFFVAVALIYRALRGQRATLGAGSRVDASAEKDAGRS